MQAVILAAGDGGRLHPLTSQNPKPLLEVRGRALIHHALDALRAAAVTDVVVVLGYRGEQIRRALETHSPEGMRVRFVHNDGYELGNARSLWAARGLVDGPFVLMMADHLVAPSLVQKLVRGADGTCLLAVERTHSRDARAFEATRARIRDGLVLDLGKTIPHWNALDTGVFWCTPDVFDAMTPEMRDGEAGAVFAALARSGKLHAVDVSGRLWIDVDTVEDLRRAEQLFGNPARHVTGA